MNRWVLSPWRKHRWPRGNIRGTHFLVADWLSVCNVLTEAEQAKLAALRESGTASGGGDGFWLPDRRDEYRLRAAVRVFQGAVSAQMGGRSRPARV